MQQFGIYLSTVPTWAPPHVSAGVPSDAETGKFHHVSGGGIKKRNGCRKKSRMVRL